MMEIISPKLSTENDFLMNNGKGLFFLIPVKQVINQHHPEHEVENPSKYHGLFLGTTKLMDGWFSIFNDVVLTPSLQKSFETNLVSAWRTFEVDGRRIREEIFIPLEIHALSLSYDREVRFQPEFDIRDRYSHEWTTYDRKYEGDVCILSSRGVFIAIFGSSMKPIDQYRYKLYPQDYERGDMAERWCYSPCFFFGKRFHLGFGRSEKEALENMKVVREGVEELKVRKEMTMKKWRRKYRLFTSHSKLNKAYSLVVRQYLLLQNGHNLPASGDRWFAGDPGWLRDVAISLEAHFELGLLDRAKEILDFWLSVDKQADDGRIADILHPTYQWKSLDGTLWLLRRVAEYVSIANDRKFFESKEDIIRKALRGFMDNYVDGMGYVKAPPYSTWMDTKFTPRAGSPVELQALLIYDCLAYSRLFEEKFGTKLVKLASASMNALRDFRCRMRLESTMRGYYADYLSPEKEPYPALTPNQLILIDIGIVDEEMEADILALIRTKLADKGIRTLAPDEIGYFEKHVGDRSYHRGSQWPLFNYMALKREVRHGNPERAYQVYLKPLINDIIDGNIGGVPELYSGDGSRAVVPHYQTWSMASFIIACREYERAAKRYRKLGEY